MYNYNVHVQGVHYTHNNKIQLLFYQNLKQETSNLESRSQLVTVCSLGPKVFMNCAGFIKITSSTLNDRYGSCALSLPYIFNYVIINHLKYFSGISDLHNFYFLNTKLDLF